MNFIFNIIFNDIFFDYFYKTALYFAVKNESTEIVKLLISHPNIDPNILVI